MKTTLTADDIRNLRKADAIVLRYDTSDSGFCQLEWSTEDRHNYNDAGTIVSTVYGTRGDIAIEPASTTVYGPNAAVHGANDPGYGRTVTGGCWVLSPARFVPQLVTFLKLLRAGDSITPMVTANDNNGAVWASGLTVDTLGIRVYRPGRNGNATGMFFVLDSWVGPHDYPLRNVSFAEVTHTLLDN